MVSSIEEFKKAFADKATDDALKSRQVKVDDALKQFKTALQTSGASDATADRFKGTLTNLVERFAATFRNTGAPAAQTAAELDDIFRESQSAMGEIKEASTKPVSTSSLAGPLAQAAAPGLGAPPTLASPPVPLPPRSPAPPNSPAPPTSAPPTKVQTMQTNVVIVPRFDTVRAGIVDWVARKISKTRARYIVNLSNLREVHQDASVLDLFGAEILARVKVGTAGNELERFDWDPNFQVQEKWWSVADGNVPAILEVFDAQTGMPIKGAIVRFPTGSAFPTDVEGLAKMEVLANGSWKVEITAPGYVNAEANIATGDRGWEGAARLAPVDLAGVDKPQVTVTVVDISDGTPVPNATVTIELISRTTDAGGAVSLQLIPGVYSFTVTAKGFVNETGKIDVRTGKNLVLSETIALRPIGAEDIFVRVLNSRSKKPIVDAVVRISSQQESTDSHGEARFLSMPFGEHRLGVQADGYKPHGITIKHNSKSGTAFKVVELSPQ